MKDLFELGYEPGQINQILKIEEKGIKILKYIDVNTSETTLRELNNILDNKYSTKELNTIINLYLKNRIDAREYIDKGIRYSQQIRAIEEVKEMGYDEKIFYDKDLSVSEMNLIFKYMKKGQNIIKYVKDGFCEREIKIILKVDEKDLYYDKLKEMTQNQKSLILSYIAEKINPMPYINKNFTIYQIEKIENALEEGIDVEKVIKYNNNASTMSVIIKGLKEGIDITKNIDKTTTAKLAEAILKCMREKLDISKIIKYKDVSIFKVAVILIKNGYDTSLIDDNKYNIQQLKAITNGILEKEKCKNIDINKILDPDYPNWQMEMIINLMKKGKKLDDILVKNIKKETLRYVEKENLLDNYFNGLLNEKSNITELSSIMVLKKLGYKISK